MLSETWEIASQMQINVEMQTAINNNLTIKLKYIEFWCFIL